MSREPIGDGGVVDETFSKAHARFLDSLPRDDIKRIGAFSTKEAVSNTLISLRGQVERIQDKTLLRWLDVFNRLNGKLQPYFDALNVIVGAQECAAPIYGGLRVVLLLASALPSFIDRFVNMLSLLADSFPQYASVADIFKSNTPPRLAMHLERVYDDFFECLAISAKVFISSRGKIKRPVELIATAIWKPFDSQFKNILDRMRAHHQFISMELKIYQAEHVHTQSDELHKAAHLREAQTKVLTELKNLVDDYNHRRLMENRGTTVERIMLWLNPPPFAQAFEDSREIRREDTAQWFVENHHFLEWDTSQSTQLAPSSAKMLPDSILWITGNPGCGKTIVATAIIEYLVQQHALGSNPYAVAYFFFKHLDNRTRTIDRALRAILAQILERNRNNDGLLNKFLFLRYKDGITSGNPFVTMGELKDLLRVAATELGTLHLVLDGLDEAEDPDELSRRLKDLVVSMPIKMVCLSRLNIDLFLRQIAPERRIDMDRETTSQDIRLVVADNLHEVIEEGLLPESADVEELASLIMLGADGMFLWTRLMVSLLRSPALTPAGRIRLLHSVKFPEGLNAMYDRILSVIASCSDLERGLASRMLLWIRFVQDDCTEDVLRNGIFHDQNDIDTSSYELSRMALVVCGGLVEVTPRGSFKFTHLTAKEYLDSEPWSRLGLTTAIIPSHAISTAIIIQTCLSYLSRKAPRERPSRKFHSPTNEERIRYNSLFESFAARQWDYHLSTLTQASLAQLDQTPEGHKLFQELNKFISTPLTVGHWIHCLYQGIQNYDFNMARLVSWLDGFNLSYSSWPSDTRGFEQLLKQISALQWEVQQINNEWADKLREQPSLFWDDVLIFCKTGILSKILESDSGRGTKICELAPEITRPKQETDLRLLGSMSCTAPNGNFVGVLSIICPRRLEEFWDMMEDDPSVYNDIQGYANDWMAVYETWALDSHERLDTVSYTVPPGDVLVLLRQSFRRSFAKQYRFNGRAGLTMGAMNPFLASCPEPDLSAMCHGQYPSNIPEVPQYNPARVVQQKKDDIPTDSKDDNHKRFRLGFPMALAADCRSFSVLRTVYWIDCDEFGQIKKVQDSSCVLPLHSLRHYESRWTENSLPLPASVFNSSLQWQIAQDTYVYSIFFGSTGDTILFADYQRPCSSHLLIFTVGRGAPKNVQLYRSIKMSDSRELLTSAHFHRRTPHLAFVMEGKAWIWEYCRDSRPRQLPTDIEASTVIKSLEFSACGNYLLLGTTAGVRVQNVAEYLREAPSCGLIYNPDPSTTRSRSLSQGLIPSTNCSQMLSVLGPGQILTDVTLIRLPASGKDSEHSAILTIDSSSDNGVRLGFSKEGAEGSAGFQLLSLPKSFDLTNTNVGVVLPREPEACPQIVFNKSPAADYAVSKRAQEQHPSVLSRDIESVYQISSGVDHIKGIPQIKRAPELELAQVDKKRLRGFED